MPYTLTGLQRRFAEVVRDLMALQVEHGRLQEFHDDLLQDFQQLKWEYGQMLSRLETAADLLKITDEISVESARGLIQYAIEGAQEISQETVSRCEGKRPHVVFLDEGCVCD